MPVIEAYEKSDGTVVRRHFRLPAGARRETALLGMIAAGVLIVGNSNTAGAGAPSGEQRLPQPGATVVYPIKRPGWDTPTVRPTPTVSYPIVFPSSGSSR